MLHISGLTRNVAEPHLREIFGSFGRIKSLTLALDPVCGLSKGYAIIMYENSKYAEDAYVVMNGVSAWGRGVQGKQGRPRREERCSLVSSWTAFSSPSLFLSAGSD